MNVILKELDKMELYSQIQLLDIKTTNTIVVLSDAIAVKYYKINGALLNRYIPYNYQKMGGITLYKHGNVNRLSTYKLPLRVQQSPPIFDRINVSLAVFINNMLLKSYFTMFYIKETPYIIGNSMIINGIQGKAVLSILYDTMNTASYLHYNNKYEYANKCTLGLNINDYHYPLEAYLKKNIQEFVNSNLFNCITFPIIFISECPQSENISYKVDSRNIVLNILLKRAGNYLCDYAEIGKVYNENCYTDNQKLAESIRNYLFDLMDTYDRTDKYAENLPAISLEESKRGL